MLRDEGTIEATHSRCSLYGDIQLLLRITTIAAGCALVMGCSSGLPDPVLLNGGTLTNPLAATTQGQTPAPGAANGVRSASSRVLTAVALERVLGKPAATFTFQQ